MSDKHWVEGPEDGFMNDDGSYGRTAVAPTKAELDAKQVWAYAKCVEQCTQLRAENKQLRAAIDAIYQAEGDHAICDCPVHRALFRVFAEYGV